MLRRNVNYMTFKNLHEMITDKGKMNIKEHQVFFNLPLFLEQEKRFDTLPTPTSVIHKEMNSMINLYHSSF